MKLSVIVPVYNEEATVQKLIEKVIAVKLPYKFSKEVIVVDDGSYDLTPTILAKLSNKIIFLRHVTNKGKGVAIRTGLKKTSGDYIIIQDADLEYDPKYYSVLLKSAVEDKSPVVYGTRLKSYPLRFWGEKKTVLPTHLIANRFISGLTNALYGSKLTDIETCYKLFKTDVIKKIHLECNKFDFEPEITAKLLNNKVPIVEKPIKTIPRSYEEGKKIKWTDGVIAIWTLLKYKKYF